MEVVSDTNEKAEASSHLKLPALGEEGAAKTNNSEDALYLLKQHENFSSIIFYSPMPHRMVDEVVGQKKTEEIITKVSPNLMKNINPEIQEPHKPQA